MNSIQQARARLAEILRGVDGLRVYTELGDSVDPPAVMVSLPRVRFGGGEPGEPTEGTFVIPLFVSQMGDVSDQLARWLPIVAKTLEESGAVITDTADPGTWPAGGGLELPAYLIEVEVALPWL
jgi:hypothetical protein